MPSQLCRQWNALGIICPAVLLRGQRRKEEEEEEDPVPKWEIYAWKKGEKKKTGRELQAAIAAMLEMQRRITADSFEKERFVFPEPAAAGAPAAGGRDAYREPVLQPTGVVPPPWMVQEALNTGAKGQHLAALIAAGSLTLAAYLKYGASSAKVIPQIVNKIVYGSPGAGGRGPGGGGKFFHYRFEGIAKRMENDIFGARGDWMIGSGSRDMSYVGDEYYVGPWSGLLG